MYKIFFLYQNYINFIVDPADAIPVKASKRKSEVDPKEIVEKKPKVEVRAKQERRRSETKEVDGHIETHTTLSPKTPPGDPPEPEELIKVCILYYCDHVV